MLKIPSSPEQDTRDQKCCYDQKKLFNFEQKLESFPENIQGTFE